MPEIVWRILAPLSETQYAFEIVDWQLVRRVPGVDEENISQKLRAWHSAQS